MTSESLLMGAGNGVAGPGPPSYAWNDETGTRSNSLSLSFEAQAFCVKINTERAHRSVKRPPPHMWGEIFQTVKKKTDGGLTNSKPHTTWNLIESMENVLRNGLAPTSYIIFFCSKIAKLKQDHPKWKFRWGMSTRGPDFSSPTDRVITARSFF